MHVRLDTNVHAFLTNKDRRISLPQWNYTEAVELDTLEKTRDTCVEALKWVCLTFPRTRSARISSKFMQVSFIPMLRHFLVAVQPAEIPPALRDDIVEVLSESIKFDENLLRMAWNMLQPRAISPSED
jgi:hypothetical protein